MDVPSYNTQTYPSTAEASSVGSQRQMHAYSSASNYSSMSNLYSQHQARPSSANSARMSNTSAQPSPVTENFNHRTAAAPQYQHQSTMSSLSGFERSVSPAQIQASYSLQSLGAAHPAATSTSNQRHNRSDRSAVQNSSHGISLNAQYKGARSATIGNSSNYDQPITVDPTAVYDPWPEYQRKAEAARKAKETEDAKRKAIEEAEETKRKADEEQKRVEEERRRAEEAKRKAEDASKVNEATKLANQAVAKAAGEKRNEDGEPRNGRKRKRKLAEGDASGVNGTATACSTANWDAGEGDEAEIRAILAKMRQIHAKNPTLLTKLWDEERQHHLEQRTAPENYETPQREPEPKRKVGIPKKNPTAASTTPKTGGPAGPTAQTPRPTASTHASEPSISAPPASISAHPRQPSAPAVQPPQPETKGKSSTQWPEGEQKQQIAAAAAKYLMENRHNHSIQIETSEVMKKLEDSPSFLELCEWIDRRGFKLERDKFARAILQRVPALNSARVTSKHSQSPTPVIRETSLASSQTQQIPESVTRPLESDSLQKSPSVPNVPQKNVVQHYANGGWHSRVEPPRHHYEPPSPRRQAYRSPYFTNNHIVDYENPLRQLSSESPKVPMMPRPGEAKEEKTPSGPSASKQDAARKRNFAEIVDLTTLSDDDSPPPPKRTDLQQSSPGLIHLPTGYVLPSQSFAGYAPQYESDGRGRIGPPPRSGYFSATQPQPSRLETFINEHLKNEELAKPIDKRKALKRNSYDPRTIARDVLLATGRHPELPALNAHLEVLKTAFPRQIADNTDLATIRWDLIDPGEPIPKVNDEDLDSLFDDADDETEEEVPTLVGRSAPLRVVVGSNGIVNAVIDRRDPPSVAVQKGTIKIKPPRGRPSKTNGGQAVRSRPFGFGEGEPGEGRPSNSGKKASSANKTTSTSNQTAASGPASTTSSGPVVFQKGMSYAEYRAAMEAAGTPLANKKGRPVGWRKDPGKSTSNAAKAKAPERRPPDVRFPEFKCEWERCGSRLHNLETLRTHVNKLHPDPKYRTDRNVWNCLWVGCGRNMQRIDKTKGEISVMRERYEFDSIAKLHEHVMNTHISPIAWRLGDGPQSGLSGKSIMTISSTSTDVLDSDQNDSEMSEAYLSDAKGRRVTPKITILEDDEQPGGISGAPSRGPGRPPAKVPHEKAKESEEAAIRRKKEIGAGLDKGGARLANAKRRQGFQDDEEFEMVVDDAD